LVPEKPNLLISIIVPVYNIEPYIEQCLDCLKNQTLAPELFEVILIDDCSTNQTVDKIQKFSSRLNIQLVKLGKNLGPGAARNREIDLAKGQYIVFLDGDDLLVNDALERLSVPMLERGFDLITYNWTGYTDLNDGAAVVPRRRDFDDMPLQQISLIPHYLGMNMDGSVIYTTAKKSLFYDYSIRFPDGYHEDMSVIFKMYFAARSTLKFDEIIYIKKDVSTSIIHTFSKKTCGWLFKCMADNCAVFTATAY